MRIQGLIRKLREIKEKYGNVEVLSFHQGRFEPPNPSWLFGGASWDLERFANEFGNKKKIIL